MSTTTKHHIPTWAKDESCLHNRDNLTPEQVGRGYRLVVDNDDTEQPHERWLVDQWVEAIPTEGTFKDYPIQTYRVPLTVPWPPPPSEGPKTAGEVPKKHWIAQLDELRLKCSKSFSEWWSGYNLSPRSCYTADEKKDHMAEAFVGGAMWAGESIARREASKEKEATGNPWDALRLYGYKGGCIGAFLNAMHTKVGEALMLGEQVERLNAKLASLEGMYAKVVSVALDCDPIPACKRIDNQLEPPWEVFSRVKQERDDLRAKLASMAGGKPPEAPKPQEKPWTPKFKVGDRVRLRTSSSKVGVVTDTDNGYRVIPISVLWGPGSSSKEMESSLELAPWTLPAPPEGQQWHRDDWTQDMLPPGYRPLLKGEPCKSGDEVLYMGAWNRDVDTGFAMTHMHLHTRTTRPLPAPPTPKRVPLEASDVPPGSVFRSPSMEDGIRFHSYLFVREDGVSMQEGSICDWNELRRRWQIKRPNEDWQECSKEQP